jgi:hypothetical protein
MVERYEDIFCAKNEEMMMEKVRQGAVGHALTRQQRPIKNSNGRTDGSSKKSSWRGRQLAVVLQKNHVKGHQSSSRERAVESYGIEIAIDQHGLIRQMHVKNMATSHLHPA